MLYLKHAVLDKNLCNATDHRPAGERNTENNFKGFIVVKFCEKRSSSVGGIVS